MSSEQHSLEELKALVTIETLMGLAPCRVDRADRMVDFIRARLDGANIREAARAVQPWGVGNTSTAYTYNIWYELFCKKYEISPHDPGGTA